MEFRTLISAALGFAIAGAVVSFEVAVLDFWVPLSFGIIGLVFAVGAFSAAREESESLLLPILAAIVAGVAIVQGFGGMSQIQDARDDLDAAQQQFEQAFP